MENNPQVFISFGGKDERHKLVPYLKYHLKISNVNVVTDDDATGERLENLFKYIRNSRIVIVIFSVSYLESKCCLDELVEIMKCLQTEKLEFAMPIFYKVKASHVKTQTGDFGEKFIALHENHPPSMIKTWQEALEYVSGYIGLNYETKSTLSELDFVKKIVERVKSILGNNYTNNQETTKILQGETSNPVVLDVNDLNKLLHLSRTLEALDLERSCHQGFMASPAWKDLISSMQSSNNSFKIPPPVNTLQSLKTLGKESVEKATNWLALQMMAEQNQPALIFENWDKIDRDAKNSIIYSARKKKQMMSQILKGWNKDIDLKPSYGNCPSFVEVQTWDRMLEHKAPRDWHRREFRRSISYRDDRDRNYPLPYEMFLGQNPVRTIDNIFLGKYHNEKREDDTSCTSFLRYLFIRFCLSLT